ncbi:MAG: CpcT/CpeT family chromophore lyase [bacterium]|nr:CpcT/CpeT family chromophore lyase [bacterium]
MNVQRHTISMKGIITIIAIIKSAFLRSIAIVIALMFSVCVLHATDETVLKLYKWVQGSFSNKLQAEKDTSISVNRLHITQFIDISNDSSRFFVEERLATDTSMWKFRCIWRIKRVEEGMIELVEFDLPDNDKYDLTDLRGIGIGGKNFMIDVVGLRRRRGCEVNIQFDGNVFGGSTHGTGCRAQESGGSYRTVEVKFMIDGMLIRERSFNALSEQIGGPQRSYEIFIRE